MKNLYFIFIFCLFICCSGQNNQSGYQRINADTLLILPLKNKQYMGIDYKVLRLCNIDSSGYWIDSTRRIELTKDNQIVAIMHLPVPDFEVKNFSVTDIKETKRGFKIDINWGGNNYFYDIVFYFKFYDGMFYLYKIKNKMYIYSEDTTILSEEKHNICIMDFDIKKYLNNEK